MVIRSTMSSAKIARVMNDPAILDGEVQGEKGRHGMESRRLRQKEIKEKRTKAARYSSGPF
jgi:hypothetical protein